MLTKITKQQFDSCIDYAYSLALDITKSSYPTFTDNIKTKSDFVDMSLRGLEGDNEILLFTHNGTVHGWVQVFWEEDNRYLQLQAFLIDNYIDIAITQLDKYIADNFVGYEVYMGFAPDNKQACSYLSKSYKLIEHSYNHVLHFSNCKLSPCHDVPLTKIDRDNFHLFASMHDSVADTYWTSSRLQDNLDKFYIYVAMACNKPVGYIYYNIAGGMAEIYGVQYDNTTTLQLLLSCALYNCAVLGAEHMCYLATAEQSDVLVQLGFDFISQYYCFCKQY